MTEKEIFSNNYAELQQLEKYLQNLHFHTQLHDVSEYVPLPLLMLDLKQEGTEMPFFLNIAFTPFPSEDIQYTRYVQLSAELPVDVNDNNLQLLLDFSNIVNGIIPIGHFILFQNKVCYRYSYPLSSQEAIDGNSFLETMSLFSLLLIEHSPIFKKLSLGLFTLEEARREFMGNSEL